ncbi:hypothetical protein [Bradyrhizobium neotropicale]|uniref:DUF2029 domain-containing protein n=1 Tax=Bradyrhizobium neotropicale TaxID=1497615 RepID=A0A176Z7N1_9BRAD|nr:hypothetical protein [Bradyrhizobium neotropicale]OAF15805.1 hypothetical protein AXW67_15365 [Bradyrhizobium neotropicale]
MSDVSGAARWFGPSADLGAPPHATWLACLIALVALLVLGNLANDTTLDVKYGWDVRVNCAAVDAHVEGLDPYFVRNLKGTRLSYPYLPVTLDAFRPFCARGFLVGHYRSVYLVLAVLCGLLLPGLRGTRASPRDVALRVLCALGAFVGFEWVAASGNFAVLSGVLTAVALALLLRPGAPDVRDDQGFVARLAGAALLGLVMSFKLVFCPVLAALYFLPLPRRRKIILIAVAGFSFALPILISMLFYPDLFSSWLLAIKGQIPNQHSVYLEETNPSLLLLARSVMDKVGLADSQPVVFATYGLAALALLLAPFAVSLLRAIGKAGDESFLTRLDRWLMDHPHAAMRVTVLAMYAFYLCSPRLKEYAFFELALYAAVLIVDLPAAMLAAMLTVAIAIPTLASITGNAFVDSFGQIAVAILCFWILLLDFRAVPKRLAQEGSRP